ncbi:hypothetical protein M422DRAFT_274224 [Sphaerobolus stellatus SS14]|uniref:WD40 repeat-like protein n=1 Tax=Sphaerobolus stellatus (strain SS14) TaxID=990650 RepID=A0A0C9T7E4_SPHS4|nr:hypothetical protein M422DRAFT_274224 [Sphaerobolus stellatus SS14]
MSRSQLPLVYKHFRTLEGHKTSVNSIRFSPEGDYLATGDDDGYVLLWTMSTGKIFDCIRVSGSGPITDIIWVINTQNQLGLFFSTADGSIFVYVKTDIHDDQKFSAAGVVKAHTGAVEMLAFDVFFRRLASIGGGQLKLWDISSDWIFTEKHTEPSKEYIAKTVHFFSEGRHVLVGYLESHRIIAWSIEPWKWLWERSVLTRIGNSALSPSAGHLAIDNLKAGIDIYILPQMVRHGPFTFTPSHSRLLLNYLRLGENHCTRNRTHQVAFLHDGESIVQGGKKGQAFIYHLSLSKPVQRINHGGAADIQAVTAYSMKDFSFIVTGSASQVNPTVKVWTAKREVQNNGIYQHSLAAVLFCVVFWVLVGVGLVHLKVMTIPTSSTESLVQFFMGKLSPGYILGPGQEPSTSSHPLTLTTTIYLTVGSSEKPTDISEATSTQHTETYVSSQYTITRGTSTPTPPTESSTQITELRLQSSSIFGKVKYTGLGNVEELRKQLDVGTSLAHSTDANVIPGLL